MVDDKVSYTKKYGVDDKSFEILAPLMRDFNKKLQTKVFRQLMF